MHSYRENLHGHPLFGYTKRYGAETREGSKKNNSKKLKQTIVHPLPLFSAQLL
jgi:hypothetical protein